MNKHLLLIDYYIRKYISSTPLTSTTPNVDLAMGLILDIFNMVLTHPIEDTAAVIYTIYDGIQKFISDSTEFMERYSRIKIVQVIPHVSSSSILATMAVEMAPSKSLEINRIVVTDIGKIILVPNVVWKNSNHLPDRVG